MTSTFGWLDYDEVARRRMREIVGLLQDAGSIDELGLGRMRDAFSERFFPGTSVLWRRARYLLFVPWTYQALERDGWGRSADPERGARRIQRLIRDSLSGGPDTDGVIGLNTPDPKSPPDVILWAALAAWGIRDPAAGTLNQYRAGLPRRPMTSGPEDGATALTGIWADRLPRAPGDFPDGVRFDLRRGEAEFLRDLVLAEDAHDGTAGARRRASMLASLLRADEVHDVPVPWAHPLDAAADDELREVQWLSGCFSDAMHGATLLYALLLARTRQDDDLIDAAEDELERWADRVSEPRRLDELQQWGRELPRMWEVLRRQNSRIGEAERRFVERWTHMALGDPTTVGASDAARELVLEREAVVKGGRARLSVPRDQDRGDGGAIPAPLTFRWGNARSIIRDIRRGLEV